MGTSPVTMPVFVLPGGGGVVIIGQKTLREKLGIDVMVQLKAYVLNAHGRQDGRRWGGVYSSCYERARRGAVLRVAMAVTAFGPVVDAPDDVDDEVTLTLRSRRSVTFQDSEVEMKDHVGALETVVDDVVDLGLPP